VSSGEGQPLPFRGLVPGDDDETDAGYYLRDRFGALSWGPTTDNVCTLFREGDRLAIALRLWREEHLLSHPEFVGTLEDLVAVLDGGPSQDRS
jgi:hypothetical protein